MTTLFFLILSAVSAFSDNPTDIEVEVMKFLTNNSTCYWVSNHTDPANRSMGANIVELPTTCTDKDGKSFVVCTGTISCFVNPNGINMLDPNFSGAYIPKVFYEGATCMGTRGSDGKVHCGGELGMKKCIVEHLSSGVAEGSDSTGKYFRVNPANVEPVQSEAVK